MWASDWEDAVHLNLVNVWHTFAQVEDGLFVVFPLGFGTRLRTGARPLVLCLVARHKSIGHTHHRTTASTQPHTGHAIPRARSSTMDPTISQMNHTHPQ